VGEAASGVVAWVGVSLVVLADGRRGLALGMALGALGLAGVSLSAAGPIGAIALAAGGAVAAARRFTAGPAGWAIMPAGSTPRLVLCVAGGLLALWVGVAVMTGSGGALRFALIAVVGLAGARVLAGENASVVQTALALLAIAIAAGAGLAPHTVIAWTYLAAGLVAAAVTWLPDGVRRAA